jgi:hypothetical protein
MPFQQIPTGPLCYSRCLRAANGFPTQPIGNALPKPALGKTAGRILTARSALPTV